MHPFHLQVIDPHTHKFMQRMQDEPLFLALAQKVRPSHFALPLAGNSADSTVGLHQLKRTPHHDLDLH